VGRGRTPGAAAAVPPAAVLQGSGSSTQAAVGKMGFGLFPVSLEGHACMAHRSNKVRAGKKGEKPLLIMKARSGKGS